MSAVSGHSRGAQGFVLPLTLWILAAITIVAGFLAERVHRSIQLAQAQQDRSDAMVAFNDARAEILFRLATQPLAPCGLGAPTACVALDGRSYASGAALIQLQDARGLLSLEVANDEQIGRLLALYGLGVDRRPALIDALRDYVDADSLRRVNGAESPEYAAAHLAPPRNGPLLSPMELRAVYGWAATKELWQSGPAVLSQSAGRDPSPLLLAPVSDYFSADSHVAINPNTAPEAVLMTLPGVTRELAQVLVERRRLEPLTSSLVDALAGGGLIGLPPHIIAYPADAAVLTLAVPGQPWRERYNIQLTPRGEGGPWQITSYYRLGPASVDPPNDAARVAAPVATALTAPPPPLPPRLDQAAASARGLVGPADTASSPFSTGPLEPFRSGP